MRNNFIKVISILGVLVLLAALASTAVAAPPQQDNSQKSIVDIAIDGGQFTTLVAALEEAGLVDRLQEEGPFTVFAPTDEAFAKLPEGALEDLFANKQALTDVLLYHVIEGQLASADVIQQEAFEALTGQAVIITTKNDTVMVNGAEVLTADLTGSNGVIHVIDTVLMPPTAKMVTGTEDNPTPAEAPTTQGCVEDYVVQASDTLSLIADKYLGDTLAFAQLVEATNTAAADNQTYTTIDNPDLIQVGQTICIPGAAEAATTGPAEEVTPAETTANAGQTNIEVPEGKAVLQFENYSFVDLVVDVSGPTSESLVVAPDAKQEFVLEPGQYNYNAHQPGGDFNVAPGSFELEAGQVKRLTCSDSPTCAELPLDTEVEPSAEQ